MVVSKMMNSHVLIVGGGVAGIAAATKLISAGSQVTLLEAEERLGGRVHTIPFGEACVDLGAHWVHGEVDNAVYAMAAPLDLLESSNDIENIQFIFSDRTEIQQDIGARIFERCGMILNDEDSLGKAQGSVAQYITDRLPEITEDCSLDEEEKSAFLDWAMKFECTIEGCDTLWDASSKGLVDYKHCEGDPTICFKKGGYSNIIDLLMGKGMGGDDRIGKELLKKTHFKKEVKEVSWDNSNGVQLMCSDGSLYRGDYAIITVSLAVLKEVAKTLFKPSLPPKNTNAIENLGIGTVDKIYLYFENEWWPHRAAFSLLYKKSDPLPSPDDPNWARHVIGFYTEKNAPKVLSAWVVGEAARSMEESSDLEVKATCMSLLKKFLGHLYSIPEPTALVRSKWFKNHHFRGSYSYRSLKTLEHNTCAADLATPLTNSKGNQVVFFAGEATHDHFYSTVHGALESGWREADRIIKLESQLAKCSL